MNMKTSFNKQQLIFFFEYKHAFQCASTVKSAVAAVAVSLNFSFFLSKLKLNEVEIV